MPSVQENRPELCQTYLASLISAFTRGSDGMWGICRPAQSSATGLQCLFTLAVLLIIRLDRLCSVRQPEQCSDVSATINLQLCSPPPTNASFDSDRREIRCQHPFWASWCNDIEDTPNRIIIMQWTLCNLAPPTGNLIGPHLAMYIKHHALCNVFAFSENKDWSDVRLVYKVKVKQFFSHLDSLYVHSLSLISDRVSRR